MKCSSCGKTFSSFEKYAFHIEYVHHITDYFICPINNCYRLYHRKCDLKKHVQTKHEVRSSKSSTGIGVIEHKQPHTVLVSDSNKDTKSYSKCVNKVKDDDCVTDDSFETFLKCFDQSVQLFISKLYDNLNLPRNSIDQVIQSVQQFLSSGIISIFQENFKLSCKSNIPDKQFQNLYSMLEVLQNPFKSFDTEYKRLRVFEKCNYLIKPVEHRLGMSPQEKQGKDGVALTLKPQSLYYVPMAKQIKLFLELPDVCKTVLDYQKKLLHNFNITTNMSNIVHGAIYKAVHHGSNRIILPLLLYFDDFETGNPLGSKAGCYKIGIIYCAIATIPPQYLTRLENIFLTLIFYSNDRVLFGNKNTFNKLINELRDLENNGIEVSTPDGTERIYFTVISILGDNLGLHSILGLVESFSATYFCRFCTTTKSVSETQIAEDDEQVRRVDDYHIHLSTKVGIKEICVWHELRRFHVYDNLTCDVMHDLYEGIHRYDMALIIKKLIDEKFFDLDHLNSRLRCLSYHSFEKNKPPKITKDHIAKGCIVFSASEMVCLVRNFRFAVGDLVPENNLTWNFYLKLLDITDILSSREISKISLELLQTLIQEHHALYIQLFSATLKPKHHLLLHYPRIIEKVGPPILISSMRFEAKHKDFKATAHYLRCRKNLPYSLALRMQLKCCYRLMSRRGFNEIVNYGFPSTFEKEERFLVISDIDINDYFCVTWYENDGVKYYCKDMLLFKYGEEIPQFCRIDTILIDKDDPKTVIFLCQSFITKSYSQHFKSYEVRPCDTYLAVNKSNLISNFPTILHRVPHDKLIEANRMSKVLNKVQRNQISKNESLNGNCIEAAMYGN